MMNEPWCVVGLDRDIDPHMARAVADVLNELDVAVDRFPPFHSPHEGIAVIREEYLELEREVFGNNGRAVSAREEAVQLAAMALRYLIDIDPAREP